MRRCLNEGDGRVDARRLVLIAAVSAAILPAAAHAAEDEDTKDLPEVVVTASRLGVGLPGTSTTVITAEEIEKSTATTLPEILSHEAGIQSRTYYSSSASHSSVDMRGFGATATSNTLVLVNGRRQTDFDLAGVTWNNIPLDSIERIEISRGNSGAVLYGDGAVGGVINIITKTDAPDGTSGRASVSYGSYTHRETNFSLTHRSGAYTANAYGTGINSGNYRDNNDIIRRNLVTELRYETEKGDVYANMAADDQTLHTPGSRSQSQLSPDDVRRGTSTPNDYTAQSGLSLTVGGNRMLSDDVEALFDVGYRNKDTEARTVSAWGGAYNTYIDTELSTWSMTPRLNIDFDALDRASTATVGVDYYYSDYSSDRQLNPDSIPGHQYDAKQHSAAFYAQGTVALSDATDLSVGGRTQYTHFTGGDIYDATPSVYPSYQVKTTRDGSTDFAFDLGIDHRITSNLAVFGRIARSFRAPNVDERIGSNASARSFELKTQTSQDAEIGTRFNAGPVEIQSSAYYMKLRDELHLDPDAFVNENFDPTRRWGVENSANWQATDDLRFKANLTYTNAEFTDGPYKGNKVPLVSDWTAGVTGYWDIIGKQLSLTTSVNYYSSKNMENDEKNFQPEMPGYTLVDLKLNGEYKSFFWAASLNNAFDVEYYNYAVASSSTYGSFNAYPLPGRTYLLEAGLTF